MKKKTSLLVMMLLALMVSVVSLVSAQEIIVAKSDKAAEAQNGNGQGKKADVTTTETAAQTTVAATATDDEATATDEQGDTKGKGKDNKGQVTAQAHRSAVATFVQGLLMVADREGGIGQEVKAIAQQQNDVKDKVADEITAVESRSKIKTFFLGSDYKNLGDLRSQMVQARNRIDQLKRLAAKADNDQDKAALETQIQVLEQEQVKIDSFITQNENQFSLFGWAVKLFQ